MSLRTSDFDYTLPEELIARYPLERREASRMLVVERATGRLTHTHFAAFPEYMRAGDLVVLNDTRVIPARVFSDDGRTELLFLEPLEERVWKCLVKPGRRMRVGMNVSVRGNVGTVEAILQPDGERVVRFAEPVDLEKAGVLPLPPYFGRQAETADAERYQTVYAREPGAVAAPTAGLHFTPELLAQVPHAFLTLHVGVGTFRSVQVENLAEHHMHAERFQLSAESAARIQAAGRVVAIGTTSTRVLETVGRPVEAREGSTNIFIHPPYEFQVVGALLTNFHLPKSTLLMLISAFAGRELVREAYEEAIRERYRFYSYGDCMLLV